VRIAHAAAKPAWHAQEPITINKDANRMLNAVHYFHYRHVAEIHDWIAEERDMLSMANMVRRYRYFDPSKTLAMMKPLRVNLNRIGLKWVILKANLTNSRGQKFPGRTLVLTQDGSDINEMHNVTHSEYSSVDYFNVLALLYYTCNRLRSIGTNRIMIIDNKEAIVRALFNYTRNHDWRTIEVREALVNLGWQIILYDSETHLQLQTRLQNAINTGHFDRRLSHMRYNLPNLDDIRNTNTLLNFFNRGLLNAMQQQLTSTMTRICPDILVWLNDVSHKYICGRIPLMLTGLIEANHLLKKATITDEDNCLHFENVSE